VNSAKSRIWEPK